MALIRWYYYNMSYIKYKNYIDNRYNSFPNNECFSYLDYNNIVKHQTNKDIYTRITSFKAKISSLGIIPGNKICLLSNNLFYSQVAFLASSYLNNCVVLIDPKLPISQVEKMLSNIDVCLFLTDNKIYERFKTIIKCKALDITNNYEALNNLDINSYEPGDLDEMAIIFSSGTTAKSKPIVLTYDSIINSAIESSTITRKCHLKSTLCLLPTCHISSLINLICGLYISAIVQTVEYFDLKSIKDYFLTFNPNAFLTMPLIIENMINELEIHIIQNSNFKYRVYNSLCKISLFLKKKINISCGILLKPFYKHIFGKNLKVIICSASQLTQVVINKINAYGIVLNNTYASTECGNPITQTFGSRVFDNTVGRIDSNPNVRIKLININENNIGEICVKTNTLMKCYYLDPKTTNSSFTDDGYFKTGDLGKIVKNYLYICGRNKETIKLRNGKKLSPSSIEEILEPVYPKDNKVYISGYSSNNDEYDDIYAFILDKNYDSNEKESIKTNIIKFNNEKLGSYPIKDVIFINGLPLNSLGKLKRYELKNYIDISKIETNTSTNLLNILSKYIHINADFDTNSKLNSLGIDSLSMYSIILDIQNEYKKNITPFLTSNTTIKDLIKAIESNKEASIKLRKIKPDEIEELAKIAAESFCDYPLYKIFYPDDNDRKTLMFYNCWYVIYKRQNYSYVTDDKSVYIAFKKPGDKSHSLFGLFFKHKFITKFISNKHTIPALKLLSSYGKFSNDIKNKYFNPNEDNYIENLFVKKETRGNGLLYSVLSYFDDGHNIYAETHLKENAVLFEKLGMNICEIDKWCGIDHYALYKKQ